MIEFGDKTRRSFRRVGSLGLGGAALSLPQCLAAKARGRQGGGREAPDSDHRVNDFPRANFTTRPAWTATIPHRRF